MVVDQMKRKVRLEETPQRIISIVPSQTQLLHFLGLEEQVVGITKFCIHPDEWFRSKPRVGGTKSVDIEKVQALKPDLIIGNKEENAQDDIEKLEDIAPVWMSDIFTLEDALTMIRSVSSICGESEKGETLVQSIEEQFKKLEDYVANHPSQTVLYYIWNEPNMVSGKQTFVDDMLRRCGWVNATSLERYPEVNELEQVPDLIFLSSEPFPFKDKHINKYEELFPGSKVVLVDGEMFSWYGSKLKDAPDYFISLMKQIHQPEEA